MIKPKRLRQGDKVAAISLSWGGAGTIPLRYEAGKQQLEAEFGVTVVETAHALRDAAWLQANPQARADDLMTAFADPSIKAIIATIGGDDSIRLLPHVDLEMIRQNPKIFMGYSDTTVSHLMCYKAGLASFYGPSMMSGFGESGGMFPYMVDAVRRTLFEAEPVGRIVPNREGWVVDHPDWAVPENQKKKRPLLPPMKWRFLQGNGVHQGHLLGGCIEVLDWLRGTSLWPSLDEWQDAILFIETSEDAPPPDNVKYMLRVLAAVGVLSRLAGILVGRPGGGVSLEQFDQYDAMLQQVVTEEEGLSELPIISRMDFGHTDPMFVLPYGVQAEIDCSAQQFAIVESAVAA